MSAPVINPRYEVLDSTSGPATPPYLFAKARDREEGRVVTLQMLPAALLASDPARIREFQAAVREARTLDHPGILRVFDQGIAEDSGDLYVVREPLRGITLQERIRRIAPFTLTVAVDIAQAVAESLAAAHRAGVVHGDLRPCHVLLSPEGQIKIADFAYGALVAGDPGDPSRAAYLPPESAGGLSPAADVYALGAMLYEMLTGVLPLAGTTRVTSPQDVNPGIPPALDGLVQRALHPDVNLRYRSAGSMLTDLQAIQDALRTGKPLTWSPLPGRSGEKGGETKSEKRTPRGSDIEATLILPRSEVSAPVAETLAVAARDLEEERNGMRVREPSSILGRVTGIMFVLAVLGVIGLVWYFVKDFAQPPNDVSVPNLIGKTFDDAKRIAEQQRFTLVESPNSDYSDTMPENQIYQQNPLPGHMIKAEKEVTVYRSLGPRLLTVPSLVGMTQDRAGIALQQENLPLGNITQEFSQTIPNGVVLRQSPDGSSKVARNTAVNFTVSKGKQPPDAPTDVAGSPDGFDKATLHWHAMPRAESYTILRSLDGDTNTIARGLPETHFTDTNLKPNTTYSYTVNAVNSAGESGPSESVLVTTDAKPDVQPVLPDDTVVTSPAAAGGPPDNSATGPASSPPTNNSMTARLRQFTIDFRIPRRPRRSRHVQIEVQDTTGTNLIYDENHDPGEMVSAPEQAFGNKITFRIFLDSKLVKQETL